MNINQIPPLLIQKLGIMSSNWLFVHEPERLRNMPMEEFRSTIKMMREQIVAHPLFDKLIWNKVQNYGTPKEVNEHFDEIQVQAHKILDMIDKEEKLKKDFL